MYLVYENPIVTLIAIAGRESSAGLPGVTSRRSQYPKVYEGLKEKVLAYIHPTWPTKSRSIWTTRPGRPEGGSSLERFLSLYCLLPEYNML